MNATTKNMFGQARPPPMVLPDGADCAAAALLGRHPVINTILGAHLALSIVGLVLIFYVLCISRELRRFFALIHVNLKVLLLTAATIFVLHAVLVSILRLQSLLSALSPSADNCFFQWRSLNCLLLKVPIYFCVFGFSACHFGLFVERLVATVRFDRYADCRRRLSVFVVLFLLLISMGTVFGVYAHEDVHEPRAYCLSTTRKSAHRLQALMCVAAALDLLSTIGDFLIYRRNRRLRKRAADTGYSLARSFQIRENQLSLELIFPLSAIHSTYFLTYLIVSVWLRSVILEYDAVWHIGIIEALQTAVCLYIVIIMSATIILWRRIHRREPEWLRPHTDPQRTPTDIYFEQLRNQMETRRKQSQSNAARGQPRRHEPLVHEAVATGRWRPWPLWRSMSVEPGGAVAEEEEDAVPSDCPVGAARR